MFRVMDTREAFYLQKRQHGAHNGYVPDSGTKTSSSVLSRATIIT